MKPEACETNDQPAGFACTIEHADLVSSLVNAGPDP
jgi:hypothetical protein